MIYAPDPTWSDSGQGDLLELVAQGNPSVPTADEEWQVFSLSLLAVAASNADVIRPNELRPLIRGKVAPRRIGAFTSRAIARGLVEYTGDWEISDDTEGRNSGKPARVMRWIGGAS